MKRQRTRHHTEQHCPAAAAAFEEENVCSKISLISEPAAVGFTLHHLAHAFLRLHFDSL